MRITIIGAGFSGSALAAELARTAPAGVDLCLVGTPDGYGRGVAYGEARPEHLLNVRARELGASQDQPGEFARWLNLTRRAGESFLPRLVYGEYLYSRLQSAAQVSLAGFNQVQQEAVAVEREGGAFRVTLADGSDFLTDQVVLAVRTSHPLVSQLRDAGTLGADPFGLGVRANARLQVLDRRGDVVDGLYCLGPLLRGQLWEITAVAELRVAAHQLAAQLLSPAAGRSVREPLLRARAL